MTVDAVLFDMDGLLIDSERLSMQAFHDTCEQHALSGRTDVFKSLIGMNEAAHVTRLAEDLGDSVDSVVFRQDWRDRYQDLVSAAPIPVKPGVHELLQWLEQEGIKRAVATSSVTEHAESKLRNSGILAYFMTVTGGDQAERSKPHPDIFLAAGQSVNADMSRSIGLEDSHNGVHAAVAAGLSVVQIPDLVQPSDELLQLGHRVCSDLHEVLTLIKQNEFLS